MANEHIINSNLVITGSVSSSVGFSGDGSGLTNITSTSEWDGSRNGDSSITGSLVVSGSTSVVDFTNVAAISGSLFSGSFSGNGSGLTNLTIFPFDGDAIITGSLIVSGSNTNAVDFQGIDFIRGGTFSGSFLGNGSLLTDLNINGIQASGSTLSGSFSGSFEGDGSGLTGLTAEWDGSRDGDSSITGSLDVSGSSVTIQLRGDTTIDQNILISNTGDLSSIGIGSGSLEETTQTRNTIAIGTLAGKSLISGSQNIYIGEQSGESAIKTIGDTAVGYNSLISQTGFNSGTATNASCNTAFGAFSLKCSTTGRENSALGYTALQRLTTGRQNTGIGQNAGFGVTGGCCNTIVGAGSAGLNINSGCCNTLLGVGSGCNVNNSDKNTAVGSGALKGASSISGDCNVALGALAGECVQGASRCNVYIGPAAGPSGNTTENKQLYISAGAGTPLIKGDFSTGQVTITTEVSASIFSGSFVGDGSSLTGIVSEWDGSRNGDSSITGSLIVSGSTSTVDFTNVASISGSNFSGSYFGNGSGLTSIKATQTDLQVSLSSNQTVGGIASGSTFAVGTDVEDILRQILISYIASTLGSVTVINDGATITTPRDVGDSFTMDGVTFTSTVDDPNGDFPMSSSLVIANAAANNGTTALSDTVTASNSSSISDTAINRTDNGNVTFTINTQSQNTADTPSASKTIKFQWRNYLIASSTAIDSNSDLATAFSSNIVQSALDTNISWTATADSNNNDITKFTYIVYPSDYGDLSSIIQDGATPVLGGFTKQTDRTANNEGGISKTWRIYKSNSTGAFASGVTLTIS